MKRIVFTVDGTPQPQGSMKNVAKLGRRSKLISANSAMKPWREQVGYAALAARPTATIWAGRHVPVKVMLYFTFERRGKAARSRRVPSVRPDIDKLCRACLDAMTGILWEDDGQVTDLTASKTYGSSSGLAAIVEIL